MSIKQVIVAREDLCMTAGKLAAQVAHAAILAYEKADKEHIDKWNRDGVTKIVLGVGGRDALLAIYEAAVAAELPTVLVCDEGRTEVQPGTITCCGIGPAPSSEINRVTGKLNLYGYNTISYDKET